MLTIYGIEVDSVAMESRLPQDKVHRIKGLLTDFAKREESPIKTVAVFNRSVEFCLWSTW